MANETIKTGYRNWIILGAAGIAGYLAYRRFWGSVSSSAATVEAATVAPKEKMATRPFGTPASGSRAGYIAVKANERVATISKDYIYVRRPGFSYAPIIKTTRAGAVAAKEFVPLINGYFTRKILLEGKRELAEIKPA